ncbi:MAG TPA: hypothetical protein VEC60_14635, partial [Reyranella sp.]|nr:hypothetical protein [Reyranella sp.]
FVAGALPLVVRAQSGDALAHAEQTCLDHGVGPSTVNFDLCVGRAARAFDRAEPAAAAAEAQRIADATGTCMSYDMDPMTLGYRQCMATESRRGRTEISFVPDGNR